MKKLIFSLFLLVPLVGSLSSCREQSKIPEPQVDSVPLILPEINPAKSFFSFLPSQASVASNPTRPVFEFTVNPSQVAGVQLETVEVYKSFVRDGVFGEITHGEAAYLHDLREILNEGRSEGLWRRAWHTRLNGNLYPTHGLGPVANYMNINRGDRFDYLVSMSSPSRSLDLFREQTVPKDSPKWKEQYIAGDMNTTMIKTVKGLTIKVQHDTSTPRPYDRINLIQGTKGLFRDYPARILVEGQPEKHRFTNLDKYKDKYTHWLWKKLGEQARGAGHGGMDFIMAWRLVQCSSTHGRLVCGSGRPGGSGRGAP